MRPVATWNSTAAAPTPIRLGPSAVPCRFIPWQVAQLAANSLPPSSMSAVWWAPVSAVALVVNSAYAPPVLTRPIAMSATVARGLRRPRLRSMGCLGMRAFVPLGFAGRII
jgi:hypothetical protein